MPRDPFYDKISETEKGKKRKTITQVTILGVLALATLVLVLGMAIDSTLDLVANRFHNEEVVNLERTVWHMEDGEMAKVVTFYTDGKTITVWVKKDSIQVDTLEFE